MPTIDAPSTGHIRPEQTCDVSASQISSAFNPESGCVRRWGFEKLWGIRTSSAAADLGTAVHAQREQWLKFGTPFDLTTKAGEIAIEGIEHLPDPSPLLGVEIEFEFWLRPPTVGDGGLRLVGKIDLAYLADGIGRIDDHKTHGGRYPIKTAYDLRNDVQWNLYVRMGFEQLFPSAETIMTCWHYLRTVRPYRADPVRVNVHRHDSQHLAMWDRIVSAANIIEAFRRTPVESPNVYRPSLHACRSFGGCKQTQCQLDTNALIESLIRT